MITINQVFGELTVIDVIDELACACKCSCGKEVRVAITSLLSGAIKKCPGHRTKSKKHWYKGSPYTTAQIEAKFGVSRQTFMLRIGRGMSVRAAIEKKIHKPVTKELKPYVPELTWPYGELNLTVGEIYELSKSGLKLTRQTIRGRLKCNWTVEEVLTIPLQQPRPGTKSVQGRDIARGVTYEYPEGSGKRYNVFQLARLANVTCNTIKWRLARGWSIEKIVTTPAYTSLPSQEILRYTYKGQQYTIGELAKLSAVNRATLITRLRNSWDITMAVETPAYKGANHATHRDTTTTAETVGDSTQTAA